MSSRASRPLLLASAGIGVVGVSFGMARYGYGLLLPDIRAEYELGSGELGLIGASSYAAYLLASVAAAAWAATLGARALVLLGGACAAGGMLLAGLSQGPALLVAGILVGGASAGLVFPPFSDVVAERIGPDRRARVASAISSGTGWGVAVAAPVAILVGSQWRVAWLLFAAVAVVATVWALLVLPAGPLARRDVPRLRWSWFVCPRSGPLLVGALMIGLASSVYWTFAVDLLVQAGALTTAQSRSFLAIVGVASVAAVVGGDASRRLGAGPTFVAAVLAEGVALGLLGLAPTSAALAAVSGVLFGVGYNVAVAVEVIWSADVFASRPSAGLAAVMILSATGLLVGPPVAGFLADAVGLPAVFAGGGLLLAGATLLAPRGSAATVQSTRA